MKKNKKTDLNVDLVPEDPEIEAIKAKYSKRSLNPFKNKKNQKLMQQEIDALLIRREEIRKEEERRKRQLQRKLNRKILFESVKDKIKERPRFYGTIAVAVLMMLGGVGAINNYRRTVRNICFVISDETKYIGDSLDLSYTVEPDTAKYKENEIEIVVSDTDLVTETRSPGQYVCTKEGTTTLKLIYKNQEYDSKTITIKPVLVDKLYVPDITIGHGNSLTINPEIGPDNATNKDYVMSIEDDGIAVIDDHTITGVEVGETILHLRSMDGFSYDARIDVIEIEPEQLRFEKTISEMIVGDENKLAVLYQPEETTLRDIVFVSSRNGVVSVDQEGNIIAKAPGEATITAKYNDAVYCEDTIVVKYPPAESMSLSSNYYSLYIGSSTYAKYSLQPARNSNEKVTFLSSDEKVLTVDENGLITAVAAGKATITAYADNHAVSDSIEISVSERPVTRTASSDSNSNIRTSSGTVTYVLNVSSKKFHRLSCSFLPTTNRQDTSMSREEIIAMGYTPCKKCNP